MKVFFDKNLSSFLAHELHKVIKENGHEAKALSDLFSDRTPDSVWLESLIDDPDEWIVFTGDIDLRRRPEEIDIWRGSGLKIFFFEKGWGGMDKQQKATVIIGHWPKILEYASSSNVAQCVRVPPTINGLFKVLW